ncbi:hypothetical protein QOZ80_3AG0238330 [Eleusine coracana subsp. coracana]|nr:hypothetical protein QOZ80_3AG0238330 [Eleusine coracana subsp. coracana]
MRIGVMEIISFLPYFNWLSWIVAWWDSGKRRYLVYAAVYLSPYLRTNLSLSPEESWLPIASIFICILHIQLEGAIRNYDNEIFQFLIFEVIESFQLVVRILNLLYFRAFKERDGYFGNERDSKKTGHRPNKRITSAHEFRERLRNSDIFKRWLDDPIDEKRNKSDRD